MSYTSRNIVAHVNRPASDKKFSVIIPAAGIGQRMKSYGPKCLIKVGNKSIIDNQLKHIYKYINNVEIIIVAGFEKDKLIKKFDNTSVKVVINENFETTNVVRSIGIGLEHAKYDNVIIIYGDLVFNAYTLKVPFGNYSAVLVDYKHMRKQEVGCIVNNNYLARMMYTLPIKWAQIAYFCKYELELLKQICAKERYHAYFGFEVINIIINSGGQFTAMSPKRMKIMDVDSSRDIPIAQKLLI